MQQPQVHSSLTNQHHDIQEHYLVEQDNQLKCVCQLCSCGKHRCPKPRVKGDFETSYKNHYKNFKSVSLSQEPRLVPTYHYQQRHYDPNFLKSHYQQSYHKVPQQMRRSPSSSRFENTGRSIMAPQVPFIGNSSYKDQYKPYVIKPTEGNPEEKLLLKSKNHLADYLPPIKFEGISAYKLSYVPHTPEVHSMKEATHVALQKPQLPFYGSSSYKHDFPKHKIEAGKQQLAPKTLNAPKVKFQGVTSYKDHYTGYEFQSRKIPPPVKTKCVLQHLNVDIPSHNPSHDKPHLYFDKNTNKFV